MTGGSIFLFGVPGTGKTETTRRVLKELQQEFGENTFNFVMINGMKLRSPRVLIINKHTYCDRFIYLFIYFSTCVLSSPSPTFGCNYSRTPVRGDA